MRIERKAAGKHQLVTSTVLRLGTCSADTQLVTEAKPEDVSPELLPGTYKALQGPTKEVPQAMAEATEAPRNRHAWGHHVPAGVNS